MTCWRPIVGYEGYYEVSDGGEVRSVERVIQQGSCWVKRCGQLRSQNVDRGGRLRVSLNRNGIRTARLVHQLVAEAFHGPRPPGMECCHNDGNPLNNRAENLRWDSRSENQFDRVRHGTHHQAKKTHCSAGHEFDALNTYVAPSSNRRACRICRAERKRNYRASARNVATA